MVAKKKLGFEDFTPSMPLQGVAGELYADDCFLWSQKPDETITHDMSQPHNKATAKFKKGGKEAESNTDRDVFITFLQFIAFGTTPAGCPNYPKLIDVSKTPKEQTRGVNAVIAYMQAHFDGVGAQALRDQLVGKYDLGYFS